VIAIDGQAHAALTVKTATRAGIAFVHQELNLFENLDVASNVFIGREPRRGGLLNLIDDARMHEKVKPLLQRLSVDFGRRIGSSICPSRSARWWRLPGAIARCARHHHGRADIQPDADRDRAPA
jgi:ABC-type thiamine transport system ATPase subunit